MQTADSTLKERYEALKAENPRLRSKQAADQLGVTEAELTTVLEGVTPLRPEFQAILKEVESLGYVMALTRNKDVVHERKGVYLNPELDNPHVGLFVGEDIDLRIFFHCWKYAFAIESENNGKATNGLLFFAKDGSAIHKIYLTPKSNTEAFQQLIEKFKNTEDFTVTPEPLPAKEKELADEEIDVAAFQEEWRNLTDTHHFFGMLKRHKVSRTQALRLAPEGEYATKLDNSAMRNIVTKSAEKGCEIMVFVGNPGMIQIHTGPVKKLMDHEQWFNVLDPNFNLHVNEPAIKESWVVRKPTEDGMVTALECYDENGEQIAQFFGKRKPGIPELTLWREIVAEVENDLKLESQPA